MSLSHILESIAYDACVLCMPIVVVVAYSSSVPLLVVPIGRACECRRSTLCAAVSCAVVSAMRGTAIAFIVLHMHV
jgi:hypothetical protein